MNEEAKTKQQLIDELRSIRVRLAEAETSESQEALKELMVAVLDAIPLAVVGMKERRVIFANHGVKSVFGWQPEELAGQSTRILYRSDEDYEKIAERFIRFLNSKERISTNFPAGVKMDRILLVS